VGRIVDYWKLCCKTMLIEQRFMSIKHLVPTSKSAEDEWCSLQKWCWICESAVPWYADSRETSQELILSSGSYHQSAKILFSDFRHSGDHGFYECFVDLWDCFSFVEKNLMPWNHARAIICAYSGSKVRLYNTMQNTSCAAPTQAWCDLTALLKIC